MTIQRAPRPATGFTVIRDEVLRDARLSYRARGVLAAVLSRPDNWTTSADQLATEGSEGRDAIRTALSELEEFGYVERQQVQDSKGRWSTRTVVYDTPKAADSQSPKTDFQSSVNQPSVFQALEKDNREEEPKNVEPDGFPDFWSAYPRRQDKGHARTAYTRALKKASAADLLVAARDFAGRTAQSDRQFIPLPATWLNGERWSDDTTEAEPAESWFPGA